MVECKSTPKLALLQRQCKEAKIPVMIVFEGWEAAGKGTMISRLIAPLDPRGFQVFTVQRASEEENLRPFMWRFWTKTPAKGRINILDRSWYRGLLEDKPLLLAKDESIQSEQIMNFEKELTSDGMVLMKFFLHISKEEQKKRFEKLEETKGTSWRVNKDDWKQNKEYKQQLVIFGNMITKTDTDFAPWNIVEATDREYAAVKIMTRVIERLSETLKKKEVAATTIDIDEMKTIKDELKLDALSKVDLTLSLEKDEYKRRLKELQTKLSKLHYEMYKRRIPVVLAFEGWDAAGKGGAIKRVTEKLDPRGYEVNPVAAPNDIEKAHHYLWRFWNAMPKSGHLAVFDRTWYGRVMVERIEVFCKEEEWKRAYKEIKDMEENLTNAGCIVLKLWLNIDKEEQLRRFNERENNIEKKWKITDEDWRNREKWDLYETAVNEMIVKTSTMNAPWIVVEGNSKYYARIKVLESVVQALEERMKNK